MILESLAKLLHLSINLKLVKNLDKVVTNNSYQTYWNRVHNNSSLKCLEKSNQSKNRRWVTDLVTTEATRIVNRLANRQVRNKLKLSLLLKRMDQLLKTLLQSILILWPWIQLWNKLNRLFLSQKKTFNQQKVIKVLVKGHIMGLHKVDKLVLEDLDKMNNQMD